MGLKQYQPPMTVEKQINNLKLLGLVIDDEDKAEDFLNDVSYFRLIKAYSPGLKQKNSNYYDGVTFDELVELYRFNANFRQHLFVQIERVEINMRCKIGNYKYLLPNDRHWYEFVDTIELLFEKYPNVKSKLMGFPTNWKSFLLE